MMDKIPECELGNTIDKHEGNRKILSKFGYDALKVRPCEWYHEETKECVKIRGKVRDLYVLGTRGDCVEWFTAYDACMDFRKTKTVLPFEKVLNFEKKRINARLENSKKNDVWRYRTEPPKNFDNKQDYSPKPNTFSPFEVYESIKEKRKNWTPKVKQPENPVDTNHSI